MATQDPTNTSPILIADDLMAKLTALNAMLLMTCSIAKEAFQGMHEGDQDAYLFACSNVSHEAKTLGEQLYAAILAQRTQ
jgi:hypothetical protein